MTEGRTELVALIERIRETSWNLEQAVGRTIDAAEYTPGVAPDIMDSFEVIEATLAYHRQGGVLAVEARGEGSPRMAHSGLKPSSFRRDGVSAGVSASGEDLSPNAIIDRLVECGTRLRALELLYGVLERIARDEAQVELASRAGFYRRDLLDLEDEIERYLCHDADLTAVINAAGVVG